MVIVCDSMPAFSKIQHRSSLVRDKSVINHFTKPYIQSFAFKTGFVLVME